MFSNWLNKRMERKNCEKEKIASIQVKLNLLREKSGYVTSLQSSLDLEKLFFETFYAGSLIPRYMEEDFNWVYTLINSKVKYYSDIHTNELYRKAQEAKRKREEEFIQAVNKIIEFAKDLDER